MDDLTLPGIRGTLVSSAYASRFLDADFAGRLGEDSRDHARRALAAWWRRAGAAFGPASSVRHLATAGASPLLELLGFEMPACVASAGDGIVFTLCRSRDLTVPMVVTAWGAGFDGHFARTAGRLAPTAAAWAFGFNGRCLRLWDTARGWSRSCLDADLEAASADERSFRVLWALMRAEALVSTTREAIGASDRHGRDVRASLRTGVHEALELLVGGLAGRRLPAAPDRARQHVSRTFEEALTVVYRLLFLLFAEARGLVPTWHPVYRRSYSIDALRAAAERPGRHTGLWASLQAISRLAHLGCHAGDLVVTPFNGRLFAPGRAPLVEAAVLDDELVARAIVAITTAAGRRGRERIAFADLGVEQLGAVYESVLDYEPDIVLRARPCPPRGPGGSSAKRAATSDGASRPAVRLVGTGLRRKASGTFYTPHEMTDFVVRRALEPLVADAAPERILDLKVLDPAMGSGAFLVAACRYLASAYERAIVRERGVFPGDITDDDRAGYRRLVAQRCLYGVDINPMAVQVARLSLWLATLAADRPLGFLDHRLAAGNSLVGASPEALTERPPGGPRRTRRAASLPLFPSSEPGTGVARVLAIRRRLASLPDDTAGVVRDKERALAGLRADRGELAAWRARADVWCAGWFWDEDAGRAPTRGEFAELTASAAGRDPSLPPGAVAARLGHVRRLARQHRFFHWPAEFPEVFYEDTGEPRARAGFDAVVTNPPWEMVRADSRGAGGHAPDRGGRDGLVRFVRESGVYAACADGHPNLYQLFVERCLRLARPGGRVGLIVPWGLASDHGSRALREVLLTRCRTESVVGFDNTNAVFPIHRSVRFLLLSASPGATTRETRCHAGLTNPAVLDALDAREDTGVRLTPARLRRLSGPDLALPYARGPGDLALLERMRRAHPALGSPEGWNLAFGRELNTTDDRRLMSQGGPGLPVVEGKHLEPFRVRVPPDASRIRAASRLPSSALREAVTRWRLAYRDVASSTNRLTLIAALVPPGHVTVHTAYCLKQPLPLAVQAYLCAMLNSFVANVLVRLWVTTHVSAVILARLPVPRLRDDSAEFRRLAGLALRLRRREDGSDGEWEELHALVQADAARAYGLGPRDLARVLDALPLVDDGTKRRCRDLFSRR